MRRVATSQLMGRVSHILPVSFWVLQFSPKNMLVDRLASLNCVCGLHDRLAFHPECINMLWSVFLG